MADTRNMHLGTIFTGHVDAKFISAVGKLKTSMRGLAGQMTGTGGAAGKMGKGFKGATNDMTQMNKQLSKVSGGFQRLAAAFKVTAAYGLAGTFLFGVINGLKKGVGAIVEYDQALKNLQAITGATNAAIGVMGRKIKEVASTTKFSAGEVASAMVLLGQSGFDAADALDATEAVAMLATGTLSDMTTASDLLTTSIRAFGLEANQAMHVADVMANAVNKSKLTIDKLRIAFNYMGPIAHKAGMTIEETTAAMMLLANAGLRASTIGTGLRQVVGRMLAPTRKLKEEFAAVGANMKIFGSTQVTFSRKMEELAKVVKTGEDAFRLFGLRAASAAAVLSMAGVEGFKEMYNYVIRVGMVTEMAEKQMEGLGVQAKNLADKLGVLAITLGEGGFANALKLVLLLLRGLVDLFIRFTSTVGGQITATVVGLTLTFVGLRLAIRFVIFELAALATGTSIAVARQLGIVTASVRGLTAALMGLWGFVKKNFIPLLIAGIIVGLLQWDKISEERIQKIQEEALEMDKHVSVLRTYLGELEKTTSESAEHNRIVGKLIKSYPALSGAILDNMDSVKRQSTEVKKLIGHYETLARIKAEEAFEEAWDKFGNIGKREKKAKMLRETLEFVPFGRLYTGEDEGDRERQKRISQTYVERQKLINEMIESLEILYKYDPGKAMALMDKLPESARSNLEALKKAKDAYKVAALSWEEMSPEQRLTKKKGLLAGAGEQWKEHYTKLDEWGKLDLLRAMNNATKKAAVQEKGLKDVGAGVDELEANTDKVMDEAFKKFVETRAKIGRAAHKKQLKEEEKYLNEQIKIIGLRNKEVIKQEKEAEAAKKKIKLRGLAELQTAMKQLGDIEAAEDKRILDEQIKLEEFLVDELKRLGMSDLEFTLWKLEKELEAHKIKAGGDIEILKKLAEYKKKIEEEVTKEADKAVQAQEDFTKQSYSNLESAFTHLFSDVMKGELKSFADYFKSFIDVMIDALSRYIAKLLVLKAIGEPGEKESSGFLGGLLKSVIGWAASSGGGGISSVGSIGAGWGALPHGGGVMGKGGLGLRKITDQFSLIPKLHSGLMPQEYPAILRKGEGVFTPEQMEALGDRKDQGGFNLQNLNIYAVDAKSFSELAHTTPGAILGPIISALQGGDNNLRSSLREAL